MQARFVKSFTHHRNSVEHTAPPRNSTSSTSFTSFTSLQQTTNSNNILSKFISSGKVGIGRRIQSQSLDLIPHHDHAQLHTYQKHQYNNQQKRGVGESLRRVLSSLIAGIASPSLLAIAVRLARLRVELALASLGAQSAVHSALRGAAIDRVERQVVHAAVLRNSLFIGNVVLLFPTVQLDLEGHGSAFLLLAVDVTVHNTDSSFPKRTQFSPSFKNWYAG